MVVDGVDGVKKRRLEEDKLATDGKKMQVPGLNTTINTCTTHSGVKKDHDWVVEPLPDLFHTTHKVKTQQVVKSRGQ